jgi:transcriptional regulator with XRE-family HTH domain
MSDETPAKRLQWARQHHGTYKKATEAARAFGWKISTYLGHENGDRNPGREAAKRYAKAFRIRWEWLLEGEGSPTEKVLTSPIIGEVSGGSEINLYPKEKLADTAEMPPGGGLHTAALVVQGASMRGVADDDWLVFFDDEHRPATAELTGKLCVVELTDGRILLGVLQPGRKKGRYDLESASAPTLRDQRVKWAARVTWLKPR